MTDHKQGNNHKGDWRMAFVDDGSSGWRETWFLDGDRATVEHTPQGMLQRVGGKAMRLVLALSALCCGLSAFASEERDALSLPRMTIYKTGQLSALRQRVATDTNAAAALNVANPSWLRPELECAR